MWRAITLRDHAWHGRDLRCKLAVIRFTDTPATPPDGARRAGWGPATEALAPDAPLVALSVHSTTAEQVDWLLREDPAYLLVYPTVLGAIARELATRGARLPSLRQVRTISEALSDDTRALCDRVLGVPLVDTYSAEEVGYIALQCPASTAYHVQAESVLVEVLRDDGSPCAPGEVGRVIVTSLLNFATPILRYMSSATTRRSARRARAGARCRCSRASSGGAAACCATRTAGRAGRCSRSRAGTPRGFVTSSSSRTRWIDCACGSCPDGPLDPRALVAALHGALGRDFAITVELVDEIARTPAGKLEEFVSLA